MIKNQNQKLRIGYYFKRGTSEMDLDWYPCQEKRGGTPSGKNLVISLKDFTNF